MTGHPWTIRRALRDRAGLTLMEVVLALAIFMVGSVSVIGLFVAASLLHTDAVNRRTASFIAHEVLAEVAAAPSGNVFARTRLTADFAIGDPWLWVAAVDPTISSPNADFADSQGPLLVGSELFWYAFQDTGTVPPRFGTLTPGLYDATPTDHAVAEHVLQPLTWHYILDQDIARDIPDTDRDYDDPTLQVDFNVNWTVDPEGPNGLDLPVYAVVGQEWMRISEIPLNNTTTHTATLRVLEDDRRQGQEETDAVYHRYGVPVTIAREHPRYPNFYYTVQFFPVNSSGAESAVVVSVGYGPRGRFRTHFLRSTYTPPRL